ncbi:Ferroporti-1 [Echria macrotheca]|uniref:Solute carrier family 40 member n=1 Tax=Echria macrotheca TaxID=438768 RepID=A0AAJ0F7Q0_9PEZI|nr:Ferroporti-1 [Echria macrotheca]
MSEIAFPLLERTPFAAPVAISQADTFCAGPVNATQDVAGSEPPSISRNVTLRLYTSHFLSTWNSRQFEFGAVLFLATIFPGTLLPMSIYALVRSGAAILLAQPVGSWIDHGDRLTVVRTSIVAQRLAVILSCALLWVLDVQKESLTWEVRNALFAAVVLLACIEKLGSMMNLIAVERDWLVVITEGNEHTRRVLNARMRRIDLLCKLLGPLAISTIAIASTAVAIWVTLGMNLAAVAVEYLFIAQVYKMVPQLRRNIETDEGIELRRSSSASELRSTFHVLPISSLPFYFRHSAFLPSFSLSLLYLTVLSFSGQMITYLISVGYSSLHVGLARTVSTIFELSATWVAPRLMGRIGVIRAGIWSLSWQMVWLALAVSWYFSGFYGTSTSPVIPATALAVGVALSRVGLWGYDLCAQNIVQDEVDMDHRGTFSTVESAFQNLFEMFSYITTLVFSRPEDFRWPVVISVLAVYLSGILYAMFVRKRRGHLFHAPPSSCICVKT